jgi:peptidyl-tRNA hydrolase
VLRIIAIIMADAATDSPSSSSFSAASASSSSSAAASSSTSSSSSAAAAGGAGDDTLVQYLVLHRPKGFSLGALVAQGAHAAVAAVFASRDAPHTRAYCDPARIDAMHKVCLEAPSREALEALAAALEAATPPVAFKLWVEQPEGVATALATAPYPRSTLRPLFAALKLLR